MFLIISQQTLLLILFLFVSLFFFTFPGFGIIRILKIKLPGRLDLYALSTVLGISSFTLLTYLASFLHTRDLIWVFVFFGVIIVIKNISHLPAVFTEIFKKNNSFFILVLIIGVLGMVSVNAASGLKYSQGILFWSAHGHDGIWHVSLIEQMRKENFPFSDPEYANQKLQNYHFFIDLLLSEVARILHFSILDLYFRLMPTLLSLLLGISSFVFVRRWTGNFLSGLWSIVFVFFFGNFGFVVTLLRNGNLNGESVFWIPQLFSVQGNPPQAAAVLMLTVLTYCILAFLRDRERNFFLPIVIIGSAIVEFKVYAGVVVLGALFLVGVCELIKRSCWPIFLFISILIPAAIFSLPNSSQARNFLIFEPWWFIRTMVVASDKLNWLDLELKRQTYIYEHNLKRVVQVELTAFLIYVAGNLGVRIVGLWQIIRPLLTGKFFRDSFDLFFFTVILLSFGIPLIFLQKGVAYNIIQTSQYALLFLGFLSALTMSEIFCKVKQKWVVICISLVVIVLGIPTQIGLLWGFYSHPPTAVVTSGQIKALKYLKEKSKDSDIVLTFPYDQYKKERYSNSLLPINVWSDTGYVSAISARKTLIADQEQLEIMGYSAGELFTERKEVFQSRDYILVNNFLKKYKIDYMYLEEGESFATDSAQININLIYNENNIRIYRVKNI